MTDFETGEPERDYWQEYKDDLAMGRIHEDGAQREPEPPEDAYRYNEGPEAFR
jgi:hypothetical protein